MARYRITGNGFSLLWIFVGSIRGADLLPGMANFCSR